MLETYGNTEESRARERNGRRGGSGSGACSDTGQAPHATEEERKAAKEIEVALTAQGEEGS